VGEFVVTAIILGLLWFAAQQSIKRSEKDRQIAYQAIRRLPSFLREQTGIGPWLEMDDFYRNQCVDVKCTSCIIDTIFVSNTNPSRETEFVDVHFTKRKLRIQYGTRLLFNGDPLSLLSYPEEQFPLKEDSPPPAESGSYYSIWKGHFKDASDGKRRDKGSADCTLPGNTQTASSENQPNSSQHSTEDQVWELLELLGPAERGDETAQLSLGKLYGDYKHASFDYKEAARWYREAAEQGNVDAQGSLGSLYYSGYGVPQSYSEAYFWTYLAAQRTKGTDRADEDLLVRGVATKLTPIELSQARVKVAEWSAIRQRELDRQKPATQEIDSKDPVLEPNIGPNQLAAQLPKMIVPTEIVRGMSIEEALEHFRDHVNRPNTIFSTEHWLTPKLERLRVLLSDPITAVQAENLSSVLHGGIYMRDFIEWLESPRIEWKDFFAYREQKERDALWERWKQQEVEEKHEEEHSLELEPCPQCGSKSVIEVVYGFPTDEQSEAARRGAIALGGCMLGNARFCCNQCDHRWPEDERDEES
jgi:Sel1 repeat